MPPHDTAQIRTDIKVRIRIKRFIFNHSLMPDNARQYILLLHFSLLLYYII
ncbi:MAG: hypothetical protein IJT49_06170 [Clostridia bacterium]|nr:hypothetical protein [Clostridia bacterium]